MGSDSQLLALLGAAARHDALQNPLHNIPTDDSRHLQPRTQGMPGPYKQYRSVLYATLMMGSAIHTGHLHAHSMLSLCLSASLTNEPHCGFSTGIPR